MKLVSLAHDVDVGEAMAVVVVTEWPGSFTCYYSNMEMERIPRVSTEVDTGEENSLATPAGTGTHEYLIMSSH